MSRVEGKGPVWGLTKVSCQGSHGGPLCPWPFPLCSRAPGYGPKIPQGWLETASQQGLGSRTGTFSGGKGRATRWVGRLMGIPGSPGRQPASAGLGLKQRPRASADQGRPSRQPVGLGVLVPESGEQIQMGQYGPGLGALAGLPRAGGADSRAWPLRCAVLVQ